jgi:hypothetical protein
MTVDFAAGPCGPDGIDDLSLGTRTSRRRALGATAPKARRL